MSSSPPDKSASSATPGSSQDAALGDIFRKLASVFFIRAPDSIRLLRDSTWASAQKDARETCEALEKADVRTFSPESLSQLDQKLTGFLEILEEDNQEKSSDTSDFLERAKTNLQGTALSVGALVNFRLALVQVESLFYQIEMKKAGERIDSVAKGPWEELYDRVRLPGADREAGFNWGPQLEMKFWAAFFYVIRSIMILDSRAAQNLAIAVEQIQNEAEEGSNTDLAEKASRALALSILKPNSEEKFNSTTPEAEFQAFEELLATIKETFPDSSNIDAGTWKDLRSFHTALWVIKNRVWDPISILIDTAEVRAEVWYMLGRKAEKQLQASGDKSSEKLAKGDETADSVEEVFRKLSL